jgi:hypothetical protein
MRCLLLRFLLLCAPVRHCYRVLVAWNFLVEHWKRTKHKAAFLVILVLYIIRFWYDNLKPVFPCR